MEEIVGNRAINQAIFDLAKRAYRTSGPNILAKFTLVKSVASVTRYSSIEV